MTARKRRGLRFRTLSLYLICVLFHLAISSNQAVAADDPAEVLYGVTLNDEPVSDGTILLRKGDGNFLISAEDLRRWRIRLPAGGGVTYQGKAYFLLNAFEKAEIRLDTSTQTLHVRLPTTIFDATVLNKPGEIRPAPVHGIGGFFNYELTLQGADAAKSRLDGLFEAGAFNGFGFAVSSFIARDIGRDSSVTRLETLWTIDDVYRRQSYRIGDSFTRGGVTGRPVRFGGVQWARNFSTDPGFISFPTPSIGGLADKPSVVDVYVNNLKSLSAEVPAGPFNLYNVPVTTGQGEVSLVVKDLLGREHIVAVPYYASPSLLKRGLNDFSYEAGYRRNNYSLKSNDYGDFLFSGTQRHGFSDTLTGEAHLELQEDLGMASISSVWLQPRIGVFSMGIAASHGDRGWGEQALLGYEYVNRRFSVGASTRMSSRSFDQIGLDGKQPFKYLTQTRLGFSLKRLGGIGLTLTQQRQFGSEATRILTGSYNVKAWKGNLNVTGYRSLNAENAYGVNVTYSMPLDNLMSLVAYGSGQRDSYTAGLEFQKGLAAEQAGNAYRVRAEKTKDFENLQASLTLQNEFSRVILDGSYVNDQESYRADLSGSFGMLDGNFFASRWLYQSFGIAKAAEYQNVRVYVNNQEVGRTDGKGCVVLPNLLPYYKNSIRIEEADLPMDCQIEETTIAAVPAYRSGMTVKFSVGPVRGALITVAGPDNIPLPAGTALRGTDAKEEWYVALNGQVYLTGLKEGAMKIEADTGKGKCTFMLVVSEDLSGVPDLGSFICR